MTIDGFNIREELTHVELALRPERVKSRLAAYENERGDDTGADTWSPVYIFPNG